MTTSEEDAIKLKAIKDFLRRAESTMTMGDWDVTYKFNQDTADRIINEMGLSDRGSK